MSKSLPPELQDVIRHLNDHGYRYMPERVADADANTLSSIFTSQAEEIADLTTIVEADKNIMEDLREARDRYKEIVDAVRFAQGEIAAERWTSFQFEQYVLSVYERVRQGRENND